MKKKLLFILDTFHPEYASTGQLMTELARSLQDDFEITVIVGTPKYGVDIGEKYSGKSFYFEKFEKINIVRVHTPEVDKNSKVSRMKFILTHFVNAFRATFRVDKPDLIYVISQPPVLGGYLGRLTKLFRGGKLIYNVQDFNPEQAEAVGYNTSKIVTSIARAIDNRSINKANHIVVVGRDMKHKLKHRNHVIKDHKISIINNWTNEKSLYPCDDSTHEKYMEYKEKYNPDNKFTIMNSGNIGLYYDLENIIKVIGKFKDYEDLQFVFVGDGAKKKDLQTYCKKHNIKNVKFYHYVPKDEVVYSINVGHVHMVTNQKGIKGVSVPSKIYGVLAAGKPVLGILEEDSEADMIIQDSNCGKVVEPQDYKGIEELIQWFYEHQDEAKTMGMNGRKYLEDHLTMDKSLSKYKKLLKDI